MDTTTDEWDLLLIASNPERVAILRRALEMNEIDCTLRRFDPANGAIARARRTGLRRVPAAADLILVDCCEPPDDGMALVGEITRAVAPVVLLTSQSSERLLDAANDSGAESTMFAPTDLASFLDKMRVHRRSRFLRALSVMYELGPIPVRMPSVFLDQPDNLAALSA